jgi:hypothetical protein
MTILHDCPACLFAVKSNLRQAAAELHTISWLRRTPYLLCDPDILRAVGKVRNWLKKTETLSAPFMRIVSQSLLAHQVRRNFAANWLSQFDFFWSAFLESDPICGGASNPWLSDRGIDDIPGDHNSNAHQVAQWRQSGAR